MNTSLNTKLGTLAAALLISTTFATTSHAAAFLQFDPDANNVVVGDTFTVDIQYNFNAHNTGDQDLAAFDIDMSFDNSMLDFDGYTLSDNLGNISLFEADDWSMGDNGSGSINIAELSYLSDFSFQSNNFTLASLTFTSTVEGSSDLDFTYIDLSDAVGDPITQPVFGGPGTVTATSAPVPEPSTMLLFGAGLVGLIGMKRRFKK